METASKNTYSLHTSFGAIFANVGQAVDTGQRSKYVLTSTKLKEIYFDSSTGIKWKLILV